MDVWASYRDNLLWYSVGTHEAGEPAPELKVALLSRALSSLVLTAEVCVCVGGFPQVELVKLATPQPCTVISPKWPEGSSSLAGSWAQVFAFLPGLIVSVRHSQAKAGLGRGQGSYFMILPCFWNPACRAVLAPRLACHGWLWLQMNIWKPSPENRTR